MQWANLPVQNRFTMCFASSTSDMSNGLLARRSVHWPLSVQVWELAQADSANFSYEFLLLEVAAS